MASIVQEETSALCPAFPEVIGGAGNVRNVQHHLVNPLLQQPTDVLEQISSSVRAQCDEVLTFSCFFSPHVVTPCVSTCACVCVCTSLLSPALCG